MPDKKYTDPERPQTFTPITSDYRKFVRDMESQREKKIPEIGAKLPKKSETPQQPPAEGRGEKPPQPKADPSSSASVKSTTDLQSELRKAQPSWASDGLGLKGAEASKVERGSRTEAKTEKPVTVEYSDPEVEKSTPESKKFEVAPSAPIEAFQLYSFPNSSGNLEVWLSPGAVDNDVGSDLRFGYQDPDDDNPVGGWKIDSNGQGLVWIRITTDNDRVTDREIQSGNSVPENTTYNFYFLIGEYEYDGESVFFPWNNTGNKTTTLCRNWWAASPPYFTVSLN
jgi:hypothetical protein